MADINMCDEETVNYHFEKMKQNRFRYHPYVLNDKKLANELFCKIKEENPCAVMVEKGKRQWIFQNKCVKETMIRWLDNQVRNMEREISEMKEIIEKLKE